MADPKKRDGANVALEHDAVAAKKQKPAGEDRKEDYVGEEILAWLTDLDTESLAELMSLLDPANADTVQVRFANNPNSDEIFYNSSSFITINVNDEASGSSFSAAETLMASFDTRSVPGPEMIAGEWPVPEWASGGYYSESASSVGYYTESASSVGGGEEAWSCGELDDAMLARFLGEDMI